MASPYKTLQKALDNAGPKRVFACADAPFTEAVSINAKVEVYGGFTCSGGTWVANKSGTTALSGPKDTIPLTINRGAVGALVQCFAITADSPSDMKGGGSSIGVVVDDEIASLVSCVITAKQGADGVDGTTPAGTGKDGANAPAPNMVGGPSPSCVVEANMSGGEPGKTTCEDGTMTNGGVGGLGGKLAADGGIGTGENGGTGEPSGAGLGSGGPGSDGSNSPTGQAGKNGSQGAAGLAGSAADDSLSMTGLTNTTNTDGKPGTHGQGGGGGGGARYEPYCPKSSGAGTYAGVGASGGGGGAGSCGGKGGGGGKAGGSSIGIVSLGAHLSLIDVTITVNAGGKGGAGATGQAPGLAGVGAGGGQRTGTGSTLGGDGGKGGRGGFGGAGSGGRGGHSIGIAYKVAPSTEPLVTFKNDGVPGAGGDPGLGAAVGENGQLGSCWDFSKHQACPAN